jgi:phosphatidylcholine synthase
MTHTTYSRREIQAAWVVHAITASGVIVGMMGLSAIIDDDARGAIVWLVVALVLDGVDGPLARRLDVRNRVPLLNGNSLDLIIDYFTCAIVPVAFLVQFDVLPRNTNTLTGFVILFVSALWMARTDQETADGWFRGFPAEWNVILPSLYLLNTSKWVNLVVCVGLCALTLSRVEFPHPVSVVEHRAVSLPMMILWIASMTFLAATLDHSHVLRVGLVIPPMWIAWQVLTRHRREVPAGDGGAHAHPI